ncbi:MAG: hypothetical protein R2701_13505 [Acidimicrobiales bacterium]
MGDRVGRRLGRQAASDGEHPAPVDPRDHTGVLQCVVHDDTDVRSEYVLRITGTVAHRPEGTVNDKLPTGEVELR